MTRYRWSVVAAVVLGFAAGCSKTNETELARSRAEVEALRAELTRLQAQHNELRMEVEQMRVARQAPQAAPAGRKPMGNLTARFEAATALTNPTERQRVYVALGLDAATTGDADTAKNCIEKITDPSVRQDVIYRSAIRLAGNGKTEDGVALAKTLTNPSQRQKALTKIAEGNSEE